MQSGRLVSRGLYPKGEILFGLRKSHLLPLENNRTVVLRGLNTTLNWINQQDNSTKTTTPFLKACQLERKPVSRNSSWNSQGSLNKNNNNKRCKQSGIMGAVCWTTSAWVLTWNRRQLTATKLLMFTTKDPILICLGRGYSVWSRQTKLKNISFTCLKLKIWDRKSVV